MATVSKAPTPLQRVLERVGIIDNDLARIKSGLEELEKQKDRVYLEIGQKFHQLTSAVQECLEKTRQQLEAEYAQQRKGLLDGKVKLQGQKKKLETDLRVDELSPVTIPAVSLIFTVHLEDALKIVNRIQLVNASLHVVKQEPVDHGLGTSVGFFVKSELSRPSLLSRTPEGEPKPKKLKEAPAASASSTPLGSAPLPLPSPNAPPSKASAEDSMKMTVQKLRDYIRCIKCNKPRCVYSNKKLRNDDERAWRTVKDSLQFQCGVGLFHQINQIIHLLVAEKSECSKVIHWQYFSKDKNFPVICYNCGGGLSSASQKNLASDAGCGTVDMIVHDVCWQCKERGIKPRTRKITKPSAKTTGETSAKIKDFLSWASVDSD